eukprot:2743242-Rhodomonas_salina.3
MASSAGSTSIASNRSEFSNFIIATISEGTKSGNHYKEFHRKCIATSTFFSIVQNVQQDCGSLVPRQLKLGSLLSASEASVFSAGAPLPGHHTKACPLLLHPLSLFRTRLLLSSFSSLE